jgi:hypothetical protein
MGVDAAAIIAIIPTPLIQVVSPIILRQTVLTQTMFYLAENHTSFSNTLSLTKSILNFT